MIRLYEYKLPLESPRLKVREGLILQWNEGWGEISPLPGFSSETLQEARAEILEILPHLASSKPKLPSVHFGLSCAAKPFIYKPVQLPLCSLGPDPHFSTVKLKLGHLPLNQAIELTKQHLHTHHLRLDCNRAWTLDQALQFARHFEPTDFAYLEEPLQTFEDLIRFSKITHLPLAVDESLIDCPTPWNELPSLKAVVVKPMILGSIPVIPPHLDLILSSSYESGLGLLHIAQLYNIAQTNSPIGLDTYRSLKDDILVNPIRCSSGLFSWSPSQPLIDILKLCLIVSVP
jgi:O-succinylbenzoate synthase